MTTTRKAVGIDLGTTFSAIAHIDAYGKPQIIPNSESERITPSVILFDGANAVVGTYAKQNSVAEPEKIVDFVKREMGKSKEEFHREFADKVFSAEELSALILKKLKNDAERYLGRRSATSIITVPAYFNDSERTATIHAGQLAGFNVLQIINEPTAAALAYGLDKLDTNQTVFVFDLGGGTFDVTIMRIEDQHIKMLATNGDHRLGGKDWDDIIVNLVAEEFDRLHGENPLLDLQSYQELQSRALAAKIQLSSRPRTTLVHSHNGKSIKIELTRDDFEKICAHLVEKTKTICEIVMQEAHMNWSGHRQDPARRRHDAHAHDPRDDPGESAACRWPTTSARTRPWPWARRSRGCSPCCPTRTRAAKRPCPRKRANSFPTARAGSSR